MQRKQNDDLQVAMQIISHNLPSAKNPLTQFQQILLINNIMGLCILHCQLLTLGFTAAILQPTDYPINGGIIGLSSIDFQQSP